MVASNCVSGIMKVWGFLYNSFTVAIAQSNFPLYVLQLEKGMSQDEATSSGEETKLVALSVIGLCLAELVSY